MHEQQVASLHPYAARLDQLPRPRYRYRHSYRHSYRYRRELASQHKLAFPKRTGKLHSPGYLATPLRANLPLVLRLTHGVG